MSKGEEATAERQGGREGRRWQAGGRTGRSEKRWQSDTWSEAEVERSEAGRWKLTTEPAWCKMSDVSGARPLPPPPPLQYTGGRGGSVAQPPPCYLTPPLSSLACRERGRPGGGGGGEGEAEGALQHCGGASCRHATLPPLPSSLTPITLSPNFPTRGGARGATLGLKHRAWGPTLHRGSEKAAGAAVKQHNNPSRLHSAAPRQPAHSGRRPEGALCWLTSGIVAIAGGAALRRAAGSSSASTWCDGSGGVCASGASGGGSYLLAMLPLSANSRITCASYSVNQYLPTALPPARRLPTRHPLPAVNTSSCSGGSGEGGEVVSGTASPGGLALTSGHPAPPVSSYRGHVHVHRHHASHTAPAPLGKTIVTPLTSLRRHRRNAPNLNRLSSTATTPTSPHLVTVSVPHTMQAFNSP
ncbi:hypothetical protein Pcinc_037024 [Petrolisthes cinctipes]|uniref:Uncharacterized protein n=1 Tax=Petrolisthes cinctipes TaxID=88211 RepID=A0AAE1BTR4_PETCI|nr:hypothetical protein Pcinc_037024 [Petrolisthes cinctipes]